MEAQARWLVAASAMAVLGVALLAILPERAPRLARRTARLTEGWRFAFALLVATQGGHVAEHVAQMAQLHVLGLPASQARGIIGALDLEWVHFGWSLWILALTAILFRRFPWNRWLLLGLVLGVWHELEHATILSAYLSTGVVGTPGLLARGGLLGGGLPIARPDLHFLYNAMITIPLVLAFRAESLRAVRTAALWWGTA